MIGEGELVVIAFVSTLPAEGVSTTEFVAESVSTEFCRTAGLVLVEAL